MGRGRTGPRKSSELPRKVTDQIHPIRVEMRKYLNGTEPGNVTEVYQCLHYEYIFPEDLENKHA